MADRPMADLSLQCISKAAPDRVPANKAAISDPMLVPWIMLGSRLCWYHGYHIMLGSRKSGCSEPVQLQSLDNPE